MASQVCKVYIVRGFTEAAYMLSAEERAAKLAQGAAARQECGGRLVVNAVARWANNGVYGFGAEIFPDLESLQNYTDALENLDWYRYVDAESFIGTPSIINEPEYENPIYEVLLIHGPIGAGYEMPEEKLTSRIMEFVAKGDEVGIRRLVRMRCRWSREDYYMVQVFEWPNLEAQMKKVAFEEQAERPRLISQHSILGVKAP